MNHTIALNPVLPVPQIALAAVVVLAAAIWIYVRVGSSQSVTIRLFATLRAAALICIALLLLDPVFTLAAHDLERPPLLVLMDTSHSMAVPDIGGRRRFDVARDIIAGTNSQLIALKDRFSLQLYDFSDRTVRTDIASFMNSAKPDGTATRIGEALASAVDSQPAGASGGVLIVSDGRNNGDFSPVEAARESRERGFPVFTMCLGTQAHGQNASIMTRRPQVYAAPGQTVSLTGEIRSVGLDGQIAHVELLDGNGGVNQSTECTLEDSRPISVSFPVTQTAIGNYKYTLAVKPLPGEVTTADNYTSVFLQVIKNKARVLVLEARPTWDAKFLIQALRTDPTISVDALFKLTDQKYFALKHQDDDNTSPGGVVEGDQSTFKPPSTAAELAHYDVIVIGKGYSDLFGPTGAAALEDYVANHAGNVIFLRGKAEDSNADTLEQLEPLKWTSDQIADIKMEVTEEGKNNPAFDFTDHPDPEMVVQQLPSLLSATRVDGEKALSVVLARSSDASAGDPAQQMAVVAYQNYGQGKVVGFAGEGLWQWALLPPSMKDYSGCFNEFWTQMVHWLVNQSDFLPGEDVSLKTDRSSYARGDTVDLLAFTRGASKADLPPVVVADPAGLEQQIVLHRATAGVADFAGTYRTGKMGEYVASMARADGSFVRVPFTVYPDSEEDMITAADPAAMQAIASAGGGDVITKDTLQTLPAKLKAARLSLASSAEPVTAWDRWWILAIILALLTAEWLLRRRSGLI